MNHFPISPFRCAALFRGLVLLLAFACSISVARAQADPQQPGFWVTSSAEVHVKPDQAILYMAIRCSASSTTEALADCDHKMQVIQQALDGMDLKGKYRSSENHFGSIRVTYPPTPYPSNQPPLMEVSRYIFVAFEAADMVDPHFPEKLAGTIDVLTKSGAVQPDTQVQPVNLPSAGPVIYTLKNPEPAFLGPPNNQTLNPLSELHLQYSSYMSDDVTVQASSRIFY